MVMLDKYCAKSEETTTPVLKRLFQVALWCIALSIGSAANAQTWPTQTWPSRPIKLIVPTGPGAATDIMARLIAESVSRTLGRPMFVENMPGASGILAHETAARAAPDGYTLLFTNTSGMAAAAFAAKLFNKQGDLGLVEVPYRSAAQATQDVAKIGRAHV